MIDALRALSPEQQQALLGLFVMLVFALVKAALAWSGKPLSQTAGAKLMKFLTVAAATALGTLLTTGATPQFWFQWIIALGVAVASWEGVAKLYSSGRAAADGLAYEYMVPVLIAGLLVTMAAPPALAQPGALTGSAIAAFDNTPVLGTAVSWQAAEHLWLDIGIKREAGTTDEFAGASTDWPLLPAILELFDLKPPRLLKATRYGAGWLFEEADPFFYMAKTIYTF